MKMLKRIFFKFYTLMIIKRRGKTDEMKRFFIFYQQMENEV